MADRLTTMDELAELLQVPKGTLYQWRHRGVGPRSIKVGRWVRYRAADVDAWLDSCAEPTRPRSS